MPKTPVPFFALLRRAVLPLVALVAFAAPVRADLMISELCDPRLNYNIDRFIEIYNSGNAAVDLTGWTLVAIGNTSVIETWTLSGLIDPHQALVCGDDQVTSFTVDFPDSTWNTQDATWNGNVGDGAKLVNPSSQIVDFVQATASPTFENGDYVRNSDITSPNTVYTPAEWTFTAVDSVTQASPGTHSAGPPPTGPTIASITTDPQWPLSGQAVNVQADVTDATFNLTGVTLSWGLSPLSVTNTIAMSVVSGDTYGTVAPIPAQAAGVPVYYRVSADNDAPATTNSNTLAYAQAIPLTIHAIQGEAAASAYDGQYVSTSGVVTGVFGSTFTIQDGAGAWNGLWARGDSIPAVNDALTLRGRVSESDGANAGNTMLLDLEIESRTPGASPPAASAVSSAVAASEAYEGVLVRVENADCTDADVGGGEWDVDDGSGPVRVGSLGYTATRTLGSTYDVAGPVGYASVFKIQPRSSADVAFVADNAPPEAIAAYALNDTAVRVVFSEPVQSGGASIAANYAIPGLSVLAAGLEYGHLDRVLLAVSPMSAGGYTVTATGISDLNGNVSTGTAAPFTYVAPGIPAGYYASAAGLSGDPLFAALHDIIKGHTSVSYTQVWTAFYTTDPRTDDPNKVWDIYSDIPGGTPPYLYTFGVDEGGSGLGEGNGYTREHTWPQSWFNGSTPTYSDVFLLYPCDAYVNGNRGNYPYGETDTPEFVSLNGSKRGPSVTPGYAGTVFEPIDAFKGDLARAYFYITTRYYLEDPAWGTSPATDKSTILPWELNMLLEWSNDDPVSQKEIDRNNAIYAIQHNRNPYVDHPEFIQLVFGPVTTAVGDRTARPALTLLPAAPNPFSATTRMVFELPRPARVTLQVFDVTGALVRTLVDGPSAAGRHEATWDGRDASGRALPAGMFFERLQADGARVTRKLVLAR